MDIILIPGLWLEASSWNEIVPLLENAGHRAHPVTRTGGTPQAQTEHIVALADRLDGPVVVVGHSASGPIAYAVADARPERVKHVIYVDSFPAPAHGEIESEFPVVDGTVPLPDFAAFDKNDVRDLDDELQKRIRALAVVEPLSSVTGPLTLRDERRRAVPATVIGTALSTDTLKGWIEDGIPWMSELAASESVDWIDLPTGHWPQFSKPRELSEIILSILATHS
jgi:pimeloyl-ACP methyl ester carboxylesterase